MNTRAPLTICDGISGTRDGGAFIRRVKKEKKILVVVIGNVVMLGHIEIANTFDKFTFFNLHLHLTMAG